MFPYGILSLDIYVCIEYLENLRIRRLGQSSVLQKSVGNRPYQAYNGTSFFVLFLEDTLNICTCKLLNPIHLYPCHKLHVSVHRLMPTDFSHDYLNWRAKKFTSFNLLLSIHHLLLFCILTFVPAKIYLKSLSRHCVIIPRFSFKKFCTLSTSDCV